MTFREAKLLAIRIARVAGTPQPSPHGDIPDDPIDYRASRDMFSYLLRLCSGSVLRADLH